MAVQDSYKKMIGNVRFDPMVEIQVQDQGEIPVFHHDIKESLIGSMSYETQTLSDADGANVFKYAHSIFYLSDIARNSTSGISTADASINSPPDKVRMICIKHLGLDKSGAPSAATDVAYIWINGGTRSDITTALLLEPGESMVFKLKDVENNDLHMQIPDGGNDVLIESIALIQTGVA